MRSKDGIPTSTGIKVALRRSFEAMLAGAITAGPGTHLDSNPLIITSMALTILGFAAYVYGTAIEKQAMKRGTVKLLSGPDAQPGSTPR